MRHLSQHSITKAIGSYLIVWALLVSSESVYGMVEKAYYEKQDYSYWMSYLSVEPEKSVFTNKEKLEFRSTVQWQRSTKIHWNDIIKCDVNGNGQFSYWSDYTSGPVFHTVIEKETTSGTWFYGDEFTSYPPPRVDCIVESHIIVEPEELRATDDGDREQVLRSRSTFQVDY